MGLVEISPVLARLWLNAVLYRTTMSKAKGYNRTFKDHILEMDLIKVLMKLRRQLRATRRSLIIEAPLGPRSASNTEFSNPAHALIDLTDVQARTGAHVLCLLLRVLCTHFLAASACEVLTVVF